MDSVRRNLGWVFTILDSGKRAEAQAVDSTDCHVQCRGFRQTWVPSMTVIASRDDACRL
jgi:hypothetical protein